MRTHFILSLILFAVVSAAYAATDPLTILQSDASQFEKLDACRLLATSGTTEAIPVLEALLTDEIFSDMARYALEPMPDAEAGAALRRALPLTSDRLRAGVVASLGVRRDRDGLFEIIPLLDSDTEAEVVREAAARSLGRIAAPAGIAVLWETAGRKDLSFALQSALADGLFFAAEALIEQGKAQDARLIYNRVFSLKAFPITTRAAALRGVLLSYGAAPRGLARLRKVLRSEEPAFFAAGLRASQEMKQRKVVAQLLARLLPQLPADRKEAVIAVLGEIGQKTAGTALLKEAEEGSTVLRVAAINAAVRIAYKPVLPLLADLINDEDADLARAARNGIAYFPKNRGNATLRALLDSEDVVERQIAVELLGKGGLPTPAALLLEIAENDADEGVRLTALKGLRPYIDLPHADQLLRHLKEARSEGERNAAEEGLRQLCEQKKNFDNVTLEITQAVYGDLPSGPQKDVTEKFQQLLESGVGAVDANNANFGDTAPDVPKQLQVDYLIDGAPARQLLAEGQVFLRPGAETIPALVDPLCAELSQNDGEVQLALLRLLTVTASRKAFDAVLALTISENEALQDAARRAIADWPDGIALPVLMDWIKDPGLASLRARTFRGAVRLLMLGQNDPEGLCSSYAELVKQSVSSEERKLILSGLSKVGHACALMLTLDLLNDETIRDEALQAATTIAPKLRSTPADLEALERARAIIKLPES
ncbi:MAG: HEAT repeat domain-containing protein [Candidatus Hydrogenedentales bacterium]|jgi:HEAT repeat protein